MKFYSFSFYQKYHKYVRRKLFELSMLMGETDLSDEGELQYFQDMFSEVSSMLRHHADIEDNVLHRLLKDRFPKMYDSIQAEHQQSNVSLQEIYGSIVSVPKDHFDRWHDLYLQVNKFIGQYLLHLDKEEKEVMPFFRSNFTEDELLSDKRRLRTEREVEIFLSEVRKGIADCNQTEQLEFLIEISAHESEEVLDAVLATLTKAIPQDRFRTLIERFESFSNRA